MSQSGLGDPVARDTAVLCERYELRITKRCLQDDLEYWGEAPFADLAKLEIVTALINRRSDGPTDTRQVSPLRSGETVYRLSYGHRHRGATWYDEENGVVWLLAYDTHAFENRPDAFAHFKELDGEGRLFPGPADLEQLFRDRAARFAETVKIDAEALVAAARSAPDREHRAVIGGELGVGVVVVYIETLEEVCVAIEGIGLPKEVRDQFSILMEALFPGMATSRLETISALPTRLLRPGEVGFRLVSG